MIWEPGELEAFKARHGERVFVIENRRRWVGAMNYAIKIGDTATAKAIEKALYPETADVDQQPAEGGGR